MAIRKRKRTRAATRRRPRKRRPESAARRHEVKAELSNFSLAKAKSALTLKIYSRGEKVGELELGRGSIFWRGGHRQRLKQVSWVKFTEMMDELAYGR